MKTMLDLSENRYSSQWRMDNDIRKDMDDWFWKMHQEMSKKDFKKAQEYAKKILAAKDPVTKQMIQRPWTGDFLRDYGYVQSELK